MSRNLSPKEVGIIRSLLRPINTTAIMILGIYTFIWGLWLANPFWHAFSRAPLYQKMESAFSNPLVGSEVIWGIIAVVAGSVTIYGALRPSYKALVRGSTVAFLHWFVIAIFYFWGDWRSTGGITSLTFAVYAAFIYINIRVNSKRNRKINEMLG